MMRCAHCDASIGVHDPAVVLLQDTGPDAGPVAIQNLSERARHLYHRLCYSEHSLDGAWAVDLPAGDSRRLGFAG